ncbi:PhzF family phenazine biosynthesis protein [Haloferax mediterranei ATCC 33500]|uniref:Phenazine biosynthesis protein n=1 Tax=Haloferax mediterranei (strain ATCC 33500 / DSM 1411 / JCM 8866 / NBRC 14739 / NCIMB 2177 / R-4) TaxID=523841 RepID=I3R0Y3_HALMT|nr:PhzF family phenazine biosynthesis protein [Haloferax mediterranei]AFK17893.1 phenazine biosynthesis-like protein [Haloferax mediterranei ATCC 33500]AHZ22683.1 phenazine biosynthesis protein [Haloferax mediterranei ATCC 33500]EMA02832.1 phenazine biosynthesis-like protein [Haloferax mediterranei ATCC 33500]MDX5987984.1 PhzF family phenazine biosynthesis protein [Haloferax mediterranei ATCC 33500]QCQ74452.1 PhzF family phenazine biosynthesis protein [Haloferax mediterranei ATCC 33500]
MPTNDFHILDVFATEKYAGNQLAVFEDADTLSDDQMAALANEMNYSETTFIEGGDPERGFDVRIFTPAGEIPFAGHPTLGTAAVLREQFDAGDDVTLNLGVGSIPVEVRQDAGEETYWMAQNEPEFGDQPDHETLAEVLSLDVADLDADWPVQVVSTGLPAVMIPLRDRDALGRSEVDLPAYRAFFDDVGVENLLPFCPDPRDDANDLAARMYAPGHGVAEDPATGSANGCLAGYLARHEYFGDSVVEATVEQGYEMGRPSHLHLEANDESNEGDGGEEVTVHVGGRVEFVAKGNLV